MVIAGDDTSSLIDFMSFAVWIFYGCTMVSLLVLRYTRKDAHRPYKVSDNIQNRVEKYRIEYNRIIEQNRIEQNRIELYQFY